MEYDRPRDADAARMLTVDGDEHVRLVSEIPAIQRLPIGERLLLARRRRLQQVARYEKGLRHEAAAAADRRSTDTVTGRRRTVRFDGAVALLEAVHRYDITEGFCQQFHSFRYIPRGLRSDYNSSVCVNK